MSHRPTPETDTEFHRIRTSPSIFVSDEMDSLAVLARNLERERDEARELARELRDALDELLDPEYLYAFGRSEDSEQCIVYHAQERASKALTNAREVLP